MYGIGDKRTKRICKWIASVLTVALIFNESGILTLAAEIQEAEGFTIEAEAVTDEEQPQEQPTQAEMQEQQEGDAPETVVQEPEVPVNQESGAGNEIVAPIEDASQAELNNESYVFGPGEENEPGTEIIAVDESGAELESESESELEEVSEVSGSELEVTAVGEMAVATQEELAVALLTGVSKITLTTDISLTTTMIVPANADIVLDGQGFSLKRGADENGAFIGTMMYLNGSENAEGTSGSLTLTNICVDGQIVNTANRAGSSAIIDCGNLILDEGAIVQGNYNYGTYNSQEDGTITPFINDYGGGIQVYGELTVTERALVTGNFADEFGGGVYLAEGATLYLHADVIRENAVAEGSGYGADLYAATGSTIYYNTAIDMTRDGFYLCVDVNLIGMDMPAAYAETQKDSDVEVYINISENGGYTKDQIAKITSELEAKGYKVLSSRTNIDTTDLRDWYVYDHYDPNAWKALNLNWETEYGGNNRREKYEYTETYYNNIVGGSYGSTVTDPVYTIEDWLKPEVQKNYYSGSLGTVTLAQFKEHIYTRNEDGYPKMTFVGYGKPAYVDFLFYDPESNGEKVVNFDINSSQVNTHTLAGSGFLVNTGVESEKLYGYLVYYAFSSGTVASSVSIYYLNGVSAKALHGGNYDLKSSTSILGSPVKQYQIKSDEWKNEMSIQIKATPTSLEVRQQPKESTSDINQISPILDCKFAESYYSGFGPLVAYTTDSGTHACMRASSFTYSDLHMYFTNPPGDMLDPLERADFTQEGTQKYFINLFGDSDSEYNTTVGMGQYENYLKIMQNEGIALITDRDAPFEDYLGESNAPDSNLCEIAKEGTIDALIDQISSYIDSKNTTKIQDKIQQGEGEDGLKEVLPQQSVGNIWLKSATSGKQIRTVNGDSIGTDGFKIQIMDDITYYHNDDCTATYYVIKPNGEVVTLGSALIDVGQDSKQWPAGEYTVQQKINGASVYGYAYFNLQRSADETVTSHAVTINVHKDDIAWDNSGKTFILAEKNVEPTMYVSDFNQVPTGVYSVYDTTGAADSSAYTDTGVTVTVSGDDTAAVIDYYTVTFYDENNALGTPQIVRKNETANAPVEPPTKDGCTFNNWCTSADGGTKFDFTSPITAKTDVYANWLYVVTINVHKDDSEWNDNLKTFALAVEDEETITFTDDLNRVPKGSYDVYDTTGITDMDSYEKTGVMVTVASAGAAATVDYYTVTLHNDDAVWGTPQIVRKNTLASAPTETPAKEGYNFYRWSESADDDNDTEFNFGTPIIAKTDLYAKWLKIPEKTFTISVSVGTGGTVSPSGEVTVKEGDSQKFIITPDNGYQIDTVLVDNTTTTLNNARYYYQTLSGSVGTEQNAATPETAVSENNSAAISLLSDDNNNAKEYIFENVTGDHTLSVTFKAVPKKRSKKSDSSDSDDSPSTPTVIPVVKTDPQVVPDPVLVPEVSTPASKDSEPKTGDVSHVEVYATIGMIAGLSYLILYFSDGESGMTEEEKKEIVGALVKWARKGKRFRKYIALAIVFVILVYYHSIGKRTTTEWKELCE